MHLIRAFSLSLFLLPLGLLLGCAAAEESAAAFAADPNTIQNVDSLVQSAGNLLAEAIQHAEAGVLKLLVVDPNGSIDTRDIAAELKDIKAQLDAVMAPAHN